jgi:hypothetical protein
MSIKITKPAIQIEGEDIHLIAQALAFAREFICEYREEDGRIHSMSIVEPIVHKYEREEIEKIKAAINRYLEN